MPDPVLTQIWWQQFWMAVVTGVFTAIPILCAMLTAYIGLRSKMLDTQVKSDVRAVLHTADIANVTAKVEAAISTVEEVKGLANGMSTKLARAEEEKGNLKGILEEKNRAEREIALMAKGAIEERERSEFRKELIVEANGTKESRTHKQEVVNVEEMNVDKLTEGKQP